MGRGHGGEAMTREEAERLVETGEVYRGVPYRGDYADGAYALITALDAAGAFNCITKAQALALYQDAYLKGKADEFPFFDVAWSTITEGK